MGTLTASARHATDSSVSMRQHWQPVVAAVARGGMLSSCATDGKRSKPAPPGRSHESPYGDSCDRSRGFFCVPRHQHHGNVPRLRLPASSASSRSGSWQYRVHHPSQFWGASPPTSVASRKSAGELLVCLEKGTHALQRTTAVCASSLSLWIGGLRPSSWWDRRRLGATLRCHRCPHPIFRCSSSHRSSSPVVASSSTRRTLRDSCAARWGEGVMPSHR